MFGALYAADGSDPAVLESVAREFSPRIEVCASSGAGTREITLDLSGLTRLFGDTRTIAEALRRTAADRGLRVRVAIAGTRTAARLLVRHRAGITIVEPGTEAAAVAPLPLALLAAVAGPSREVTSRFAEARPDTPDAPDVANDPTAAGDPNDLRSTFRRWGLRTIGDVAALPPDDLAARLGHDGVHWQRLACGSDPRPLVPSAPEERFEEALDLEWPIDGLEPLSFVLGRLLEPLSAHLERRDRGAAVLHVRLHLVTATGGTRDVHARSLQLPAPIRDARTLRTLALLDLESHPPSAAIDRVVVAVEPTPGRIVQFSLLTRPLPSPEQISTLMARLNALMGSGRCGSPALADAWRPGAFTVRPFAPAEAGHDERPRHLAAPRSAGHDLRLSLPPPLPDRGAAGPMAALRRFRFPVPARVRVAGGKPGRVATDRRGLSGGPVVSCAGPWRTSGAWWIEGASWDRDEWDVALNDGTYRLFRERDTDQWFVEGIVD